MSIAEAQVIDIISTDPESGCVTLTATDHFGWGNGEHLMMLQNKLNSYLAFVESGEVFDSYPNAKGKQIKLEVVCQHEPDAEAIKFFALCGEAIENAGFGFSYRVHKI